MPISIVCPSCAAALQAPDGRPGRTAKCPKCGTRISVPSQAVQPAPSVPRFDVGLVERSETNWEKITQSGACCGMDEIAARTTNWAEIAKEPDRIKHDTPFVRVVKEQVKERRRAVGGKMKKWTWIAVIAVFLVCAGWLALTYLGKPVPQAELDAITESLIQRIDQAIDEEVKHPSPGGERRIREYVEMKMKLQDELVHRPPSEF